MPRGVLRHARRHRVRKVCLVQQLRGGGGLDCRLWFSQRSSSLPLLLELPRPDKRLNVPTAHPEQEAGRDINHRMRVRSEAKECIKQNRQGETCDDGHNAQDRVGFEMLLRRRLAFRGPRQIGQKQTALTTVTFRQLLGFSASWAKHAMQNDSRT